MIFCGIFDGHGPWGHFVSKKVRESVPSLLLCNWQVNLALTSLGMAIALVIVKHIDNICKLNFVFIVIP